MKKQRVEKMRVPYGLSVHGDEEIAAVVAVLKGNTALGDKTTEFEQKVAKLFGKKFGIMVNSGSSANLLALEILDLPRGSEVVTPLLTFATTVAPIIQKGLVPVFVDVGRSTFLADLDQIEKAITKKTKALLIPNLMGNIPDLKRLRKIAKKHKLFLIEDSCDTLGGKYAGKPTGTYSDISTTSFYGSHIINGAGGGGMIMVNDKKWAERLLVLRGWGRQSSLFGYKAKSELLENRFSAKLDGLPYDNKFLFSEVGYNLLPLEISSAFALVQLGKLPKFAKARKENYSTLAAFFKKYPDLFGLAEQTPKSNTIWLAFPLLIKDKAPFNRLELVTFLEENNIQTRPVFTGNILKQPGFRQIPHKHGAKSYPNTEYIMKNALVVAAHHGLNKSQIEYLCSKFAEFLSKYAK